MRRPAACAILLFAASCRTPVEDSAPPPSPAPPPSAPELDEAAWRAEAEEVLFERHMRTARLYRDGLDIDKALDQVEQALALRPSSEEARKLRAELQRLSGSRAGEVSTILDDAWEAELVREEERQVTVRRLLAEAREAEAAGEFERAKLAYQRAIFLTRE
jgi:tetratricopeptide (TPR) repeat protein